MGYKEYHRNWVLQKRYNRTWNFISQTLKEGTTVLDLGTRNEFSAIMESNGLKVTNTTGIDLDDFPESVNQYDTEVVTAFEIFEHLLNPLSVLRQFKAKRLYASVPLTIWFDKAYRNPANRWDQHYHEFEDWQFDWLLEKAGWEIIRREKWNGPLLTPGIRPLLRWITPRYYIVEAVRK